MSEEQHVITVDRFEQRLMVAGLTDFRNNLIHDGRPTEDVEDLLVKVFEAPARKRRRADREAR